MYWVYQNDNWYSSSWYNGPWAVVDPEIVPPFILQVPVRYYRRPPPYFHGWAAPAPPRWAEHWGPAWAEKRQGWDKVDRGHVPPAAPVPTYQRQYSGKRYPTVQQQPALHTRNYKYQPREPVVRQHYEQHAATPQHDNVVHGGGGARSTRNDAAEGEMDDRPRARGRAPGRLHRPDRSRAGDGPTLALPSP